MRAVFATISTPVTHLTSRASRSGHTLTVSNGPQAAASQLRRAAEVAVVESAEHLTSADGSSRGRWA